MIKVIWRSRRIEGFHHRNNDRRQNHARPQDVEKPRKSYEAPENLGSHKPLPRTFLRTSCDKTARDLSPHYELFSFVIRFE